MHLESVTNQTTQVWGDPEMSFGKRVRILREKQGLTAKELSARSGVPEKTIYRIETGDVRDPRLSTVETLVKALRCSADEMLFDLEAFDGNQRLRQLFEETSNTSPDNQNLVTQVVTRLNIAERLRMEIFRSDVDRWTQEDGITLEEMANTVGMDQEVYEYFKKNPSSEPPEPEDL